MNVNVKMITLSLPEIPSLARLRILNRLKPTRSKYRNFRLYFSNSNNSPRDGSKFIEFIDCLRIRRTVGIPFELNPETY
jgi:hypothetical protein